MRLFQVEKIKWTGCEKIMNIVITMAGLGSRFRKKGYNVPKYMIEAKGNSLFYWSVSSLKSFHLESSNLIFIVRKEDQASQFIIEECSKLSIEFFHIVEIDELTDGQATTVLFAKPYWNREEPIIIYNIDTHVEPQALQKEIFNHDGWVPCFNAPGDSWSFVKIDKSGSAVELREKSRISDHATIGLYWFKSAKLYEQTYITYYSQPGREEKGERYIAPIYNQLISEGRIITISDIPLNKVHMLGTPEQLEDFLSSDYSLVEG